MNRVFTDEAWDDYLYWIETDKKKLKRINQLIKDIDRSPYEGVAFESKFARVLVEKNRPRTQNCICGRKSSNSVCFF